MKKETHLAIQWTTLIIAAIGTGIALYKVFSDETSQYNYWLFILLFVLIGLRARRSSSAPKYQKRMH